MIKRLLFTLCILGKLGQAQTPAKPPAPVTTDSLPKHIFTMGEVVVTSEKDLRLIPSLVPAGYRNLLRTMYRNP
ncbi:hypothetical protein [Paraflavitalea speifideaquila]|uniref:hypothetical protein n=1 Tax=Paraflavitalea speifideaquila TaxID=3076558 RepID=UPI0028E4E17B|nr:hypothetical protein [Paraflavitalea speifideiaquila]